MGAAAAIQVRSRLLGSKRPGEGLIPTALNTDSLASVYRIEKTGDSRPLRQVNR